MSRLLIRGPEATPFPKVARLRAHCLVFKLTPRQPSPYEVLMHCTATGVWRAPGGSVATKSARWPRPSTGPQKKAKSAHLYGMPFTLRVHVVSSPCYSGVVLLPSLLPICYEKTTVVLLRDTAKSSDSASLARSARLARTRRKTRSREFRTRARREGLGVENWILDFF